MEKELADCCILMIKLLGKLLDLGNITEEEYRYHATLKIMFIEGNA